jgi:hypothetical protein
VQSLASTAQHPACSSERGRGGLRLLLSANGGGQAGDILLRIGEQIAATCPGCRAGPPSRCVVRQATPNLERARHLPAAWDEQRGDLHWRFAWVGSVNFRNLRHRRPTGLLRLIVHQHRNCRNRIKLAGYRLSLSSMVQIYAPVMRATSAALKRAGSILRYATSSPGGMTASTTPGTIRSRAAIAPISSERTELNRAT